MSYVCGKVLMEQTVVLEYLMLLAAKKGGRLVWVNVLKISRTQKYETKKEIGKDMFYIPKVLNTQTVFFSLGLPLCIEWFLMPEKVRSGSMSPWKITSKLLAAKMH